MAQTATPNIVIIMSDDQGPWAHARMNMRVTTDLLTEFRRRTS
ncbi:MAG: hypothetical protein O3B01_01180 [Planctomycetota bacterium]|nr:hypothetical protein [Planctomycetota bacterium]MDA1137168.1 hypothetical protein [Planctomycetota bacterium]